jgi:hypothetical protein
MRAQLDLLQTVIGVPNVRLGIIPLGVQLDTVPQNNFVLDDDVAKVETFVGESSHTGDQAASYAAIVNRLWTTASRGTRPDVSSSVPRTSYPQHETGRAGRQRCPSCDPAVASRAAAPDAARLPGMTSARFRAPCIPSRIPGILLAPTEAGDEDERATCVAGAAE